jgi:hypothetical protein
MTKPSDCVIGYALPTSKDGFQWSISQTHAEYAKKFKAAGWDQYEGVCRELRRGIELYSQCGVRHLHEELRASQWPTLFLEGSVVILFAHWADAQASQATEAISTEHVEFWDKMESVQNLVNQIPPGFHGVLDLSVCHPCALVEKIGRARSDFTTCYIPFAVSPTVWSEIYGSIFRTLAQFEANYVDVLEKVVVEYRRQAGRRKK